MYSLAVIVLIVAGGALIFWLGYKLGQERGHKEGQIHQSKRSMDFLTRSL